MHATPASQAEAPDAGRSPLTARWWDVMTLGLACGLTSPFEWANNYIRAVPQMESYATMGRAEQQVYEAFAAFFRACASHPEEALNDLQADQVPALIEAWYVERGILHASFERMNAANLERGSGGIELSPAPVTLDQAVAWVEWYLQQQKRSTHDDNQNGAGPGAPEPLHGGDAAAPSGPVS